ncbi:hypothetical protein [Bacillus benzoevorans]|uniref:Uncharacterized protein n=1 Tax=Bacillus benzoevorans TaxID=1456 RepID=A0A7X0HYL2_9BACI|nr:hypothetical protein [Bacillus benzoevorans]MBB6447995.1 hypothetical protein [Bacillus benzoevorans]
MILENSFIKRDAVDGNFDYKNLYNDNRGAVFKEEYKSLIREAISKEIITVVKFIVAENVRGELEQICEAKGLERILIERLKNYHNEPEYRIASLIYILKKIDHDFKLSTDDGILNVISDRVEIELRPRIDGKNAEPRIFLPNEKIAITSANDNVENLGDILAVRGIAVYVIDTDDWSNSIYAYKVNRDNKFFDVAEGYKHNLRLELGNRIRKFLDRS